jgi:hypothetical protein
MRTLRASLTGRRRALLLTLCAALAASTASWAFWGAQGSGAASGHVGSLAAPSIASATPGGGTVTLQWSAVTAPGSGSVSYYVSRDGGAPSSTCPSASAPSAQTSCTDTGVSIGTHSYTVTAVWRSWTAKSNGASAQVLTGAATHLLLSPATASPIAGTADNLTITAQDASNNTVTSYSGNKSLTFGGAGTVGVNNPTVTDGAGSAVAFGTATTISFSGGVATVSGGANGAMKLYKAETAKVTVSDGTLNNATGASVTVSPAAAASFTVPTPSTQTAGSPFELALTALDAYGNTATGYAGSKTVAFSGPANSPNGKAPVYPASVSFASGVGTAKGITLHNASAVTTLTAKEGGISGSSGSFTVAPASAASFSVPTPSTQTAGSSFELTLTALDAYGNTATGYAGSKAISFSGPANSPNGKTPSYPAAVSFTAGVGTAKPITLYNASATTTLTAKEGAISGSSASFTVSPASAASFAVPTPSTQTAGSAFNVTITAKDAYGNTATGYGGSMPVAFSGPQTSPGGEAPKYPASVSFAAGVGTASVTIYDAGSTTLTAQEGSISGTSGSFTVNGLSTTSKFLLSTPSPTAGKPFTETITATDTYGNTTTGYTGNHTLTFSGPAKAPNGNSPKYPFSSTSFSAGVGSASITLYKAETTALTVTQSTISGTSADFTVAPASVEEFGLGTPSAQTAGVAFNLTLTAKDEFGNVVTGYEGSKAVTFKGPGASPAGNAPSYPSSISFAAGVGTASITLYGATASTAIEATQGSASDKTGNFAVNAASMSGLSLAAATTSPSAGVADNLTITAVDAFGNTVTSYTSNRTLTFGGAATIGTTHPTVSSSSGVAVNFGTPETISFSSGVAKVSGSNNGVMKLYAAETAKVTVTDGTFNNGSGLNVTVAGASISSLTLSNGNVGGTTKGKVEAGDSFTVDFSAAIAVSSMCSSWSGNTTDQSITGNGEVTVTLADGGAGDDTISVSSTKCAFHLGAIDLGSGNYISGGSATFSGNGSNHSTVKYTASSDTLTVELGSKSGGTGTIKQASSSAATLTPDANLTDSFGNAFAAFTTGTTTQF